MKIDSRFASVPPKLCVVGAILLSAACVEIRAASVVSNGEKDHIFFLGLDVYVLQPEGLLPVEGFKRGCVNVNAEDGARLIKVGDLRDIDTKVEPKISSTTASVSEINGYRSYTPMNDPRMNAMRNESALIAEQMYMETTAAIAEGQLRQAEDNMTAALPPFTDAAAAAAIMRSRRSDLNAAQGRVFDASVGRTIESYESIMNVDDLDTSTADAYTVEFEVSSQDPIYDGYVVLVSKITFPGESTPVRAIEFSRFSIIDYQPRKMKVVQSPLPIGFRAESNEVHVYDANGREVATNMSHKRVEMTRSEAFEFLRFRYVSTNKLANLPASVAREMLTSGTIAQIPRDQLERTAHVEVDENGKVSKVYLEGGDSGDGDRFLADAIKQVYFYPALDYGEPVETQTTVRLGDLLL